MEGIDLKFRNLNIGYYFIFNDKAYLKISDNTAVLLFSEYDIETFTKIESRFHCVDKNFNYIRPTEASVIFDSNEIIKFVTKKDLKNLIFKEFKLKLNKIKFSELKIGDYFKDEKNNFFKKISYFSAIPIFKNKVGLDDSNNVVITSISSATVMDSNVNRILYNGEELFKYKNKSWNITWFSKDFGSYEYKWFDTEKYWSRDSKALIQYINTIPDDVLVIITNSNNVQRINDIDNINFKEGHIYKIYSDVDGARDALNSVCINHNVIKNLSRGDTFFIACKKNSELLEYKKINQFGNRNICQCIDDYRGSFIEYNYSYKFSDRNIPSWKSKEFSLNEMVSPSSLKEVTSRLLYNLDENDLRTLSDNINYDL